jgi:hypothetical protein
VTKARNLVATRSVWEPFRGQHNSMAHEKSRGFADMGLGWVAREKAVCKASALKMPSHTM